MSIVSQLLKKFPLGANGKIFIKIDTNKKYIFNGCEDKLIDIVNKYYPEIPKNNLIKILKNNNYNKFNQISLLLKDIFI